MSAGGTSSGTSRGTGRRPLSRSRRLSRCGTMLRGTRRGIRCVVSPAGTRTRRIVMYPRTGMMIVRPWRRSNHDSRLPSVHDDRILHNGGFLRRLDARAVAMGADGRAVGVSDNLHAVTDRAKRSVNVASVHPGSRRDASCRKDQRRSRQSCREVLVHITPPFTTSKAGEQPESDNKKGAAELPRPFIHRNARLIS